MKRIGIVALAFVLAATTAVSAKPLTKESVNAALERMFGYDKSVTWTIADIHPVADGTVEVDVALNGQKKTEAVFVSADRLTVKAGEDVLPWGARGYAAVRTALAGVRGQSMGPAHGVIDIVVFSEPECVHCKVAWPIIKKLAADFPDVRVTNVQFPLPASLHPWAMTGAIYEECAAQIDPVAYWKFVDAIYDALDSIQAETAGQTLLDLAVGVGLDRDKMSVCVASPDMAARVTQSVALGTSLHVSQVPTLFINGHPVVNIAVTPYEALKAIVAFEIAKGAN